MRKLLVVPLLMVFFSAVSLMASPTPAVTFGTLVGESLGNGPFTLGWTFTLSQSVTVVGLGAFDDSQDGLNESHDVGIWDSAGTLMGSATVSSGTADPLVNQFRYATTSFSLGPGTYNIGALWLDGGDNNTFIGDVPTLTTGAGITWVANAYVAGGTLANPVNSVDSEYAYFGPNFLYNPVPEPGTLAMLGSGLLGAVGVIRRKINR